MDVLQRFFFGLHVQVAEVPLCSDLLGNAVVNHGSHCMAHTGAYEIELTGILQRGRGLLVRFCD